MKRRLWKWLLAALLLAFIAFISWTTYELVRPRAYLPPLSEVQGWLNALPLRESHNDVGKAFTERQIPFYIQESGEIHAWIKETGHPRFFDAPRRIAIWVRFDRSDHMLGSWAVVLEDSY